ncbi:group-specific protein [Bacillus solitudinis]|uniref:group-specific protein n=1 Tax=Bacillus solitudinis TaxID=2014074 RepID=UPI000C233873|nr:group-specific protein [Bacillus solitudinis]
MYSTNKEIKIGDWIKGMTDQDKLVHGYVENIDKRRQTIHSRVIASDNKKMVGEIASISMYRTVKLTLPSKLREEELLNFIDISLSTRDFEWFTELTNKLFQIKYHPVTKKQTKASHDIKVNEEI